jgi:hypothetical protein
MVVNGRINEPLLFYALMRVSRINFFETPDQKGKSTYLVDS